MKYLRPCKINGQNYPRKNEIYEEKLNISRTYKLVYCSKILCTRQVFVSCIQYLRLKTVHLFSFKIKNIQYMYTVPKPLFKYPTVKSFIEAFFTSIIPAYLDWLFRLCRNSFVFLRFLHFEAKLRTISIITDTDTEIWTPIWGHIHM